MAYPSTWTQNGVIGSPLLVGEEGQDYTDGRQTYKLSKKVSSINLVLKSVDSGANWTKLELTSGYTINTTTNEITFVTALGVEDLFQVFYQSHTNMAEPTVNSGVNRANGEVSMVSNFSGVQGNYLVQSLIGKVGTNSRTDGQYNVPITKWYSYVAANSPLTYVSPEHIALSPSTLYSGVSIKTFPYLTTENGRKVVNLVFKEMKFDVDWGDDSKFNITNNVSTTIDDNANVVLIGQKKIVTPYFVKEK